MLAEVWEQEGGEARGSARVRPGGRLCLGPIDMAVEAAETRERCQVSADAHGEMKASEKRHGVRPRKTGGREDFQEGGQD